MSENKNKKDFSVFPRFVPWPPKLLERAMHGDPAIEDPVVISVYFQLYLYRHFKDFRKFLLECIKPLISRLPEFRKMDLPPFMQELFDEVERTTDNKNE